MSEHVLYEVARGVATITLAREENRNALTAELVNGLGDALGRAERDGSVRVTVLTNAGPAFCAGADLKGTSQEAPRYTLPQILAAIQDGATPVIAKVKGHCTGGGVGLAAACDVSIAADGVQLGFTEVRVGVVPAMIAVVCLPKLRQADAMELFLSGEKIPATRAVEVGLLNRAVPAAQLDEAVGEVIERIGRGGPEALGIAKSLVHRIPQMPRDEAFEWAEALSRKRFASIEAAEGMAAFREGRDPTWVTPWQ